MDCAALASRRNELSWFAIRLSGIPATNAFTQPVSVNILARDRARTVSKRLKPSSGRPSTNGVIGDRTDGEIRDRARTGRTVSKRLKPSGGVRRRPGAAPARAVRQQTVFSGAGKSIRPGRSSQG